MMADRRDAGPAAAKAPEPIRRTRRRRPTTPRSSPRSWSSWRAEDRRIVAHHRGHAHRAPGCRKFQAAFPDRFIDVGHRRAARGDAGRRASRSAGMRPVVALYSTFLQRAFDQTVHDVCQNDAPVLLAVDRAGLVGEDGTSHQGMFTIPAQRHAPEPRRSRARATSRSSARWSARRSPRTTRSRCTTRATPGSASRSASREVLPVGRGEVLREGARPAVRHVRPDHDAGRRGRGRARGRAAGRSASSTRASRSRSTAS